MIDNQLTWQDNIDSVYNKIIKFTSIFYQIRNRFSRFKRASKTSQRSGTLI